MPDRKTHEIAGTLVGAGYSCYRAKDQDPRHAAIEIAGGAAGGYVGGVLPDILEPAISSWHRSAGHSVAVGAGVIGLKSFLQEYEKYCREQAAKCAAITAEPYSTESGDVYIPIASNPLESFFRTLLECFWRFLAGFVNGVAAGYVSHLALDATTPRSIPLLP